MTYEEAVADIKEALRHGCYAGDYIDPQALETALPALEKQIPKKVIFKPDEGVPDCCICPRCGFDMMGVYDFTDSNTKDPSFCPDCGQALDWGDEE